MDKRYNSYGEYLRKRFDSKVYKVSVDAGFTCPNRDGSVTRGGCIYCNNSSFVPPYAKSGISIHSQISRGMEYLKQRFKAEKFIVYFQAYTNTYDDVKRLEELYRDALSMSEDIIGLSVGTRPDCVDEDILNLFERLAGEAYVTIEYGVESTYDRTLKFVNRGHDYESVVDAIENTRGRGINIGAHIIVGFPTETTEEMLAMADEVSNLGIDYLKVHNLHVVRNTALQRIYEKQPFHLFDYDEYVDFIIRFLERLSPDIVLERLFTSTPQRLLVAPDWGLSTLQIIQGIDRELENRDTHQGKYYRAS